MYIVKWLSSARHSTPVCLVSNTPISLRNCMKLVTYFSLNARWCYEFCLIHCCLFSTLDKNLDNPTGVGGMISQIKFEGSLIKNDQLVTCRCQITWVIINHLLIVDTSRFLISALAWLAWLPIAYTFTSPKARASALVYSCVLISLIQIERS